MSSDIISLLKGPTTASFHHDLSVRLDTLASLKETAALRAEVDAVLQSKWWDLRTKAILVIGQWGGKENKKWLLDRACRSLPSSKGEDYLFNTMDWDFRKNRREQWESWETSAARKALGWALKERDLDWLLHTYFRGDKFQKLTAGIVYHMPMTLKEAWVLHALASTDISRRKSALHLVYVAYLKRDKEEILARHIHDPDPEVASRAASLLDWHNRYEANRAR